jgi:hypothetical protein
MTRAGRDASRSFVTGCFQTHLTHDLRDMALIGASDKRISSPSAGRRSDLAGRVSGGFGNRCEQEPPDLRSRRQLQYDVSVNLPSPLLRSHAHDQGREGREPQLCDGVLTFSWSSVRPRRSCVRWVWKHPVTKLRLASLPALVQTHLTHDLRGLTDDQLKVRKSSCHLHQSKPYTNLTRLQSGSLQGSV